MMDAQKKPRTKSFLYGVLLSFFFYSLAFSLSAILFSEAKNIYLSLMLMVGISFVSAATYALLEAFIFSKTGSTAFSIGYFGAFAVGAALVFFITNIIPLDFIFDWNHLYTESYIRAACIRLCLFNAVALVIRLGIETFKYVKAVFSLQD